MVHRRQPIASMGPIQPESLRDALHRKRRSLDQEIAMFTAQKEKEYREFETRLRGTQQTMEGGSLTLRDVIDSKDGALKGGIDSIRVRHGQKSPRMQDHGGLDSSKHAHTAATASPDSTAPPTAKPVPSHLSGSSPRHREHDFQGLFTPTYLPLLEAGSQGLELDRPAISALSRKPGVVFPTIPNPTTPLSSSATTFSAVDHASYSPTQSGPLSASAPRPRSHRSSSRSDTSVTSLRSILRDLKQPHSPKHVLFSIDNVVVSPSTSPLARRSGKASSKPPIPFSGLRDMPSSSSGGQESASDLNTTNSLTTQQTGNKAVEPKTSFSQPLTAVFPSLRQLVEPVNTPIPPGGDDFEHVERDDDVFFSFEEDIDAPRRRAVNDKEVNKPSTPEIKALMTMKG